MVRVVAALSLLLVAAGGCASTSPSARGTAPRPFNSETIAQLPDRYPLPPGQEVAVTDLARTPTSSVHLVQIRHQEPLHTHQHHDLVAVLLRGRGTLRLGAKTLTMREGSVVVIPSRVPHAFVNASRRPAAALVVFSPPFDGTDTVPASE